MTGPADRIGIIAGSGSLPREVAESIVGRGGHVHVVMVNGAAETALAMFPHTVVNWAQPGRATAALKAAGVRDVVMLGGFQRPDFRSARPDLAFFQVLPSVLRFLKSGGDDAVLRGLVALFERRGLRIAGVRDVARDLVADEGVLVGTEPSPQNRADADTGFALIASLGRFDIGQAAVVANGRIEAIEGAEGTDRMLARVAEARARGSLRSGGVLVKRPKPGQDLRVDLPAIGPHTIENIAAAGLSGVAVMSGHVLVAERLRTLELAEARGVFVAGFAQAADAAPQAASSATQSVGWLGAVRPDARAATDLQRAAGILHAAADFNTGTAVVIDRGRVIAVGTAEAPAEVIGRAAPYRKGGRRRGIAVIAPSQNLDETVVRAAREGGLHGIGVVRGSPGANADAVARVIGLADDLGLFVAEVGGGSRNGAGGDV